jgi:hypothetical protein
MSRAVRHVRGPGRQAPARCMVMLAGVAAVATGAAMVPAAALAAGGGRAHRAPATRPDRHSLAASGVISTVAGGPGGPALATRVGLRGGCQRQLCRRHRRLALRAVHVGKCQLRLEYLVKQLMPVLTQEHEQFRPPHRTDHRLLRRRRLHRRPPHHRTHDLPP